MSPKTPDPQSLLPLKPHVLELLLALAAEPRHGYGLMKHIEDVSAGAIKLGPATLYRTLAELVDHQIIRTTHEAVDDVLGAERRQYYALTTFGTRVLKAEAERLRRVIHTAERLRLLPQLSGE